VGYAVLIKESVEKDIAALPGGVVLRILQDIEILSETPLPPGVRKLS